jgi:DNA mismatch repair ATPase MutL
MTIQTRLATEEVGREYSYDSQGKVIKESRVSMQPGTLVTATRLFDSLPVASFFFFNQNRSVDSRHKRESLRQTKNAQR